MMVTVTLPITPLTVLLKQALPSQYEWDGLYLTQNNAAMGYVKFLCKCIFDEKLSQNVLGSLRQRG